MKKTLRELREDSGLTQSQMAEKLGYASKSGYNALELGKVSPSLEQAKKIAQIFSVGISEIFFENKVQE